MDPFQFVAPIMTEALTPVVDGPRAVPTEFRIFPAGEFETEKGKFVFDDEAAETVMSAYQRRQVDLTIDYEHQALADPPIVAPAACSRWVPQIRNNELWATDCKWTDKAWSHLAWGEYRYISPAFSYDDKTGRVKEVWNLALTNIPAMRGIAPLVAATRRQTNGKENGTMDFEKLYNELKAAHDQQTAELTALKASNEELTAKLSGITSQGGDATQEVVSLTAALSLPTSARTNERTAAVTSLMSLRTNIRQLTGADSDAVAIGRIHGWKDSQQEVARLSAKLQETEQKALAAEFDAVLDEVSKEGKLEPAKREELKTLALGMNGGRITSEGIKLMKASLSARPVKAAGEVTQPPTQGGGTVDPIQAHIDRVCGRDQTLPNTAAK